MVFFISWASNSDCHDFTTTRFVKTQVGGVAHCWILATNGTDRLVWSPSCRGFQTEDPKDSQEAPGPQSLNKCPHGFCTSKVTSWRFWELDLFFLFWGVCGLGWRKLQGMNVPGIICEMVWTVMCKPYGFMSSWVGATWNFWNCYSWNTFSGKDFVFPLHLLLPQLPRTRCPCSCIPQAKQPRLELGTKGPKHPTAMPGPAPSAVGLECMDHGGKGAIRPLGNHKWTLPFLPTAVRFQGCWGGSGFRGEPRYEPTVEDTTTWAVFLFWEGFVFLCLCLEKVTDDLFRVTVRSVGSQDSCGPVRWGAWGGLWYLHDWLVTLVLMEEPTKNLAPAEIYWCF